MKKALLPVEASPFKSATEELDTLRKVFRTACRHYAERVDLEIIRLRERVAAAAEVYHGNDKARAAAGSAADSNAQLRDLRDMLTVMRTLEVKPLDGRRRNLKKIEAAVEDLRMLIERWG